jgi:hypothetical protein
MLPEAESADSANELLIRGFGKVAMFATGLAKRPNTIHSSARTATGHILCCADATGGPIPAIAPKQESAGTGISVAGSA